MSAPFRTEITSAATEPKIRSDGSGLLRIFPIKDLFETEIRIGKFNFMD